MKFVLALIVTIFIVQLIQPAESRAAKTGKPAGQQANLQKGLKSSWKKWKSWCADTINKLEKGLKHLKKNAKSFLSKVEDTMTANWKSIKNEVKELKGIIKEGAKSVPKKIEKRLVKLAYVFLNQSLSGQCTEEVENDFKRIVELEVELCNSISNAEGNNQCLNDCKKEAATLEGNNLRQYLQCKGDALDALKTIGKFLYTSAMTLYPDCVQAAAELVAAQTLPLAYIKFAQTLGRIIFVDIKKVYKDGKKRLDQLKECVTKGSGCVVNAYEKSKAEWNKLADKIQQC